MRHIKQTNPANKVEENKNNNNHEWGMGRKTTIIIATYHYKGMLARQHTVYCIRAICHQAINMDIVLQQFGKCSDMVLSVSVVVSFR